MKTRPAFVFAAQIIRFICESSVVALVILWLSTTTELAAQDFWRQANGPYGGNVRALAINPATRDIFAGTSAHGIFHSTDNGASWTPANNGLSLSSEINAFAINTSGHVFAATEDDGIFRTTNNGRSWTKVNTGLSNRAIFALAINSLEHIFAGGSAGEIFRSTDNGDTWKEVMKFGNSVSVYALAINMNGDIFAATCDGGVFYSTDNGESWKPTGLTNECIRSLAINPATQDIFAGARGRLFRSTDNGASWTPANIGVASSDVDAILIHSNGDIFAGTDGEGVFRSSDNGASWTPANNGLTNPDIEALANNSVGHVFAGTEGSGVFHSADNSASWTQVNNGLTNIDFEALAINSAGHIFAGTDGAGVFRSTDNGENWTQLTNGLARTVTVIALAIHPVTRHIFAGTDGDSIFRSKDNGDTWTPGTIGLTTSSIYSLAINPATRDIFAGGGGGEIFRSTDNGETWDETDNLSFIVYTLAINSRGDIFAGTTAGVFLSTDNGDTWRPTRLMNSVLSLAINSIGHIFAGALQEGVFRSMDNGENWTPVNTDLTSVDALAINSRDHIFAGTINFFGEGWVFRSRDNGANWALVNTGLRGVFVSALAIDSSGYIFAGTSIGGGVFRSTQSTTSLAPFVTTTPATNVTRTSATLNGTVNPNGLSATVFFEYGATTNYGSAVTARQSPVMGTSLIAVNAVLSALLPDTVYHYRVVAANSEGTSNGADQTFRTTAGTLPFLSIAAPLAGVEQGSVMWGDYDNDDDLDILLSGDSSSYSIARIYRNDAGAFVGIAASLPQVSEGSAVWGDYDNDGDLDILFTGCCDDSSKVYRNDGGKFVNLHAGLIGAQASSAAWGDYDNDGDLDILLTGLASVFPLQPISIIYRNDKGRFVDINARLREVHSSSVAWADYDNDADLDILLSGDLFVTTAFSEVYRNQQSNFEQIGARLDGVFSSSGAWGDYDSDGDLDILSTGLMFTFPFPFSPRPVSQVYINDSGIFSNINAALMGVLESSAVWGDYDNDGDLDILLTGFTTRDSSGASNPIAKVYRNDGGNFLEIDAGLEGIGSSAAAWGDYDNDGDLDILMTGLNSDAVAIAKVYQNTIGKTNTAPTPPANLKAAITNNSVTLSWDKSTDIETAQNALTYNLRVGTKPGGVEIVSPMANVATGYRKVLQPGNTNHGNRWTLKNLPDGAYYWSVQASDNAFSGSAFSAEKSFTIQVNFAEPGLVTESTLSAGSEQTAYRLISMPLDVDNKNAGAVLEDNLGRYQISKWRFFDLLADQSLAEFPNTSLMTPGKGFWLIVKDPGRRISSGAGKSVRTDTLFAVPLHPQWNLVGNPFHFPISIDNVSLKSQQQLKIRTYKGAWNDATSDPVKMLKPFEGYAIFNESSLQDLLLINPDTTSAPSKSAQPSAKEDIQWSICILAQCQEARDVDNFAAVISGASNKLDEMDQPEPLVIGEYVSVYFPHRDWPAPVGKTLAKRYCRDARPEPTEGEIWEFEVETNIRDKVNLTFEGVESVPEEFNVWLVDEAVNIAQNLRETNYYAVAGADHPKRLKLAVGRSDFIAEKLDGIQLIPTTYELSRNFPNPFNPATTIRYGLPQAERVTLKVYNLLGEEVVTLLDNAGKKAGYHIAIWDGRNKNGQLMASGIYVYRMQAGSLIMTKKMALVK